MALPGRDTFEEGREGHVTCNNCVTDHDAFYIGASQAFDCRVQAIFIDLNRTGRAARRGSRVEIEEPILIARSRDHR